MTIAKVVQNALGVGFTLALTAMGLQYDSSTAWFMAFFVLICWSWKR